MKTTKIDLTNKRFGNWVVLSDDGKRNSKGMILWKCQCDCGNYGYVRSDKLRKRRSISCGCMKSIRISEKITKYKDGHPKDIYPLTYNSWRSMIQRVNNPNNCSYEYYKNKEIYKQWMIFENFLADMGERPSKEYTIDRIDTTRGYYKENCCWATKIEQSNNKNIKFKDRTPIKKINEIQREVKILLDESMYTQKEIGEKYNVSQSTISNIKHGGYLK